MKIEVTTLPDTQAEIRVELTVDEVQPYVEAAAKRIAKEVDIKGFRKGKVPRDVLIQHVGEAALYEEAFQDIVEDTYPKAVEQEKLQVVGRANIDAEKVAPGNPIVYKATVPLLPEVKLGDYSKLKAKKEQVEIDEEKYTKTINDIRKMRGKEKLVKREAKSGDVVSIDFEVKVNGVAIEGGSATEQRIQLGEGTMIPGFEEAIEGMKSGEEKDFELKFPKEYKKDLAGKPANFHIKLHDVYEIELPELNDELAKGMQFESLKEMEKEIRENIQREEEQKAQEKYEIAVIDELVKKSTFDPLPPQMIDEEVEKMMREMQQDIARQGLKFEDYLSHIGKKEEELKDDFRERALQRIQAALLMRELAIDMKIEIDAKEIDNEISKTKEMYKDVPEAAAQLDSTQYRLQLENGMIHRKTFEQLENGSASQKK